MENVKNLKINYIDIQNFKNINYVSSDFWDWNIIGWYNGKWKSSLIESILTSIQWSKFYWVWKVSPWSLVKKWENKATIKLLIKWKEVEIIIERIFKKWTSKKPTWSTSLEATLNWDKISQADLNSLLNSLTIDPFKLWEGSITEQIMEIKATTWLDTREIDKEIKDIEEEYTEINRNKTQAKNVLDSFLVAWVPEKFTQKSISELLEKRKIFDEKKDLLSTYQIQKEDVKELEEEIKQLQLKLIESKKEFEEIKKNWNSLNEKIKAQWLTTIEALDEEIAQIENNNKEAQKYDKYLEHKQFANETEKEFEDIKNKKEKIKEKRTEIIANSNIPKYMNLSDDLWILVDDMEFKLLNTARKIEVAIDLILISWSPLRLIRIENWWELDIKTLKKIKEKIIKNNFQIFIERPIIDKFDSIIINDWEIVEDKEKFINNQ